MKTTLEKEEEKCNQCDYASSQTGDLRSHLKIHGRKKEKQKQPRCDNAKSGDKYNDCNWCDWHLLKYAI